jgi:hypothetical protein
MVRRNQPVSESETLRAAGELLESMQLGGENDRIRDITLMLIDRLVQQVESGVHTNPKDPAVITNDLEEVKYVHAQDGDAYVHEFEEGVRVLLFGEPGEGLCALLYRPDGRDVWDEFEET